MENYGYSYPESGDSSPRSRDIDFENPPTSWDDLQQPPPPNLKVKFMVSYGGKIQPRTHDNLLSYVGGETKILSVERSVKFSSLISKLSSLIDSPHNDAVPVLTFKYQLPGEDLDALISVTNDDDLEHMMHEFDRLYRASSKPARLRLFLFPVQHHSGYGSTNSEPGKLDRDRFLESLNSAPSPPPQPTVTAAGNADFLFGLDKAVRAHDPVLDPDPQVEARIHELNRVQISAQEQHHHGSGSYGPKSEESLGGYVVDAYQKPPPTIPASVQMSAGYWQAPPVEQQPPQHRYQQQQPQQPQQQVYMIHAQPPHPQAGVYHTPPVVRQVTGQPNQGGYYQVQGVQRVPPDAVYREQQVYNVNVAPPQAQAATVQATAKVGGYSEGVGLPVRQVAGVTESGAYGHVAYDTATGRQVYYAAPGGGGMITTPFQGVAVSGDMRTTGGLTSGEGKTVSKVSPSSATV